MAQTDSKVTGINEPQRLTQEEKMVGKTLQRNVDLTPEELAEIKEVYPPRHYSVSHHLLLVNKHY